MKSNKTKIGVIASTFKESKDLVKKAYEALSKITKFPLRLCRNPDLYSLNAGIFTIDAVPATNKVCGMRFDHLIISDRVSKEVFDQITRTCLTTGGSYTVISE